MISIESIRKEKPIFGLSFSPLQTFLTFSVPSVFPTTSHAFLTSHLGFKLLLLKFQSVWSELVKGNLKTILDWKKGAWSIRGWQKRNKSEYVTKLCLWRLMEFLAGKNSSFFSATISALNSISNKKVCRATFVLTKWFICCMNCKQTCFINHKMFVFYDKFAIAENFQD